MNKVNYENNNPYNYKLSELVDGNETAFIGHCGNGPENQVYLITYDRIVLANCPHKSWNYAMCSVWVKRFVDLELIVKEK